VLFQHDNYGFSDPVVFRSKTQCEGKTQSTCFAHGASLGHSLVEYCTNSRRFRRRVAEHHRDALRVSLSPPTDCRRLGAPTVGAPLTKGVAIACEARLAVNVDKLTEFAIIMLKEH
jgi:hypothetical protein